jgi:AcrR family transcriptional regulator
MELRSDQAGAARTPLSRERVLRAALRLADESGIDSLSMRKLGQELGVEAMSLYNHVANKDEIFDGISEVVAEEIEIPVPGGDWKAALRQTSISSHEAFVRHRWACSLMMSRPRVSPARLRWMEAVLRTLREAGFSADMTHHAYHALDSHITGFTLWQVSMPFETKEELVDLAEDFLKQIPADEYPYIIEHADQHLAPSSPDGKTEFEFGLELILDGLERIRDTDHTASSDSA